MANRSSANLEAFSFCKTSLYDDLQDFLKLCKSLNVHCKDGLDMLLWQAVFAFELFFDIKDKEREIAQAMYEAIALK